MEQSIKTSLINLGVLPVLAGLTLISGVARAEKLVSLKDGPLAIYATGHFNFAHSKADQIPGAAFTNKMTNPTTLGLGMRYRFMDFLSLGFRYEYWLTSQSYSLNGVTQKDTLNLQGVGPEIGMLWGNPRAQYALLASALYSLQQSVSRTGTSSLTFENANPPLYYLLRFVITIKFSARLGFLIESGYRKADFGDLVSGSQSFISGGEAFDLSGPFFGMGLSFHF